MQNQSGFDPEAANLQGQYAGFVTRAIAFFVDWLIVLSTIFIVTSFTVIILSFFNITVDDLVNSLNRNGILFKLANLFIAAALFAINSVFFVGYFIFFWMLVGQTPGKMLMGLRVVSTNGRPLSFWQALKRFIGYWISMIPFFMGFYWILISDSRQGWHDKIARSYVIYTWEARPSFKLFKRVSRAAEKRAASYKPKSPPP